MFPFICISLIHRCENETFAPNYGTERSGHTAAICHLGVDGGWVVWEAFAVSSQVPRRGSSSRWLALQIQKQKTKQWCICACMWALLSWPVVCPPPYSY